MDIKNIIAAISLSALVLILYSLFFAPPPPDLNEQKNKIENTKNNSDISSPKIEKKVETKVISRDSALDLSERIKIENNNIIGMPTETVYGLAGNAYSDRSVKKIFRLKKRPNYNPLIIHFKNLNDLKKDVILNTNFKKLYNTFCPGPITFILILAP